MKMSLKTFSNVSLVIRNTYKNVTKYFL